MDEKVKTLKYRVNAGTWPCATHVNERAWRLCGRAILNSFKRRRISRLIFFATCNNNASCACDSRAKATLVSDDWPLLRQLLSAKHAQLPPVAVGIMEPQPDVVRARGFWTDFVAGIFNIDADLLQMRECLS